MKLGVMILTHRRHQLLDLICDQLRETWPDAAIQFTADRPTEAVMAAMGRAVLKHGAEVCPSPMEAISHTENFVWLRDWQLQNLHWTGCEYVAMWDDDHLLANPAEARKALEDGADLVYATKAYFWDGLDSINVGLPRHTSILFSRRVDGDRWTKMVGAPEKASALPRVVELQDPLLDVGYMTAAERERVWKVYKRAGKIDQLTTGLVQAPTLHRVREALSSNEWYQRLEAALLTEGAGSLRVPLEAQRR
jgi:hypothetical protein